MQTIFGPIKHCYKCARWLPLASFSKNKRRKDGLQTECKPCVAAYREVNRSRIAAKDAEWYIANRDRLLEKQREYHLRTRPRSVGYELLAQSPTTVYRFYDRDGAFLYVGITQDFARRHGEHSRKKAWWPRVDHSRTLTEIYPDRESAREVELREIPLTVFNLADRD